MCTEDTAKVVNDIKKTLLGMKYDDPKLDSIRVTLTNDILRYIYTEVKNIEEKPKPKEINLVEPIQHYKKLPMKPMRYRFMKERNK